jgi:phage gp36-like protein
MTYIEREDLIEIIQERLLDENNAGFPDEILNGIEIKAIAFVISYISGRYDTDRIFGNPPMRHPLLVQAIAMIVVYRTVRRNAARKVPEDYLQVYNDAIKILSNIQNGSQLLNGLPEVVGDTGTTGSLMYGNTTNKDFFI